MPSGPQIIHVDYTPVISSLNASEIIVPMLAVAGAIAILYVAAKGIKMINASIKRKNDEAILNKRLYEIERQKTIRDLRKKYNIPSSRK